MVSFDRPLDGQTVNNFNSVQILAAEGVAIDPTVAGSLGAFVKGVVKSLPGRVPACVARDFVVQVGRVEATEPLFSGRAFRYPSTSSVRELGTSCTAEGTVESALQNMSRLVGDFGSTPFAARQDNPRNDRAVEWVADLEDPYQLRVRGSSGASTFSIDLGLGIVDRTRKNPSYNELWRTGIDTEHTDSGVGARFIRTGTAVKPGEAEKQAAFDQFRRDYGIMPQRLLGVLGLYLMRELKPDYAVALTTSGAQQLSTLSRSKGSCDYSGTFGNVGFQPTSNPHWLGIGDFNEGFYGALDRAKINQREAGTIDAAIDALGNMQPLRRKDRLVPPVLFRLCSDNSPQVVGREIAALMPKLR